MSGRDSRKQTEPWRQRLIRSLLYGRNVDRNAKARARVGFAILAFAAVYAVIGGRLVSLRVDEGDSVHDAIPASPTPVPAAKAVPPAPPAIPVAKAGPPNRPVPPRETPQVNGRHAGLLG